ncbi:unknown protein [Microcystis aeruginosa NIES-843]|uniref:Uncharacterized protein n=1 Tax=Microcystis aeruginosa (strain NIES-843 / IAM M-2473) TaxID=449447 RepID=B0JX81_MICAN|nr:unknown protein [Microcystis aeruginosa NIES-843]
MSTLLFPLVLLNAVCQPISLLQYLRWFKSDIRFTPNHGWLAVVSVWMLGYI